ncbi:MAG: DUF4868 domain-containing protein [Saprospiraceae bacterium]|jgi:hypothetical protein|nr:DUF4868 domain-containing protein [Saprospiraceae bacterium]
MINLFALLKHNEQTSLQRIPVRENIQNEINQMFINQAATFIAGKERIAYQGGYKADPEEIFEIAQYEFNVDFLNDLQNPLNLEIFNINEFEGNIIAIIASSTGNQPFIGFQYFDSRKILNKKYALWYTDELYGKIEDKGLTLSSKLDILYSGNSLFFSSFTLASRILNLSNFMEEATEEDVDNFMANPSFEFEDTVGVRDDLNSTTKKQLRLLVQSGVLNDLSVVDIHEKSQFMEIDLETNDNGNRIIIPRNKSLVQDLIRLLNEDYSRGIFTNNRYLSNSKRIR